MKEKTRSPLFTDKEAINAKRFYDKLREANQRLAQKYGKNGEPKGSKSQCPKKAL